MRVTLNKSIPLELGPITLQPGVNEVDPMGFDALKTEVPKLRRAIENGVVVVEGESATVLGAAPKPEAPKVKTRKARKG